MRAKTLFYWTNLIMLMCVGLASSHLLDEGYRNVGYLSLVRGNISAASDWFSRSTQPSLETWLGQVRTSVLAKNFDAAERLLHLAAYRTDMMMPVWLLSTASKFLESGDAVSALRTLDLVITSDKTNSEFWYRLGLLYERAGAREQAQEAFTAGAQRDSSGALARGWYYLARSYYQAEEWIHTIDLLTPILTSAPDSALNVEGWRESFLFLAGSQQKVGRAVEAEQTYRHLVALDPAARDWVMHWSQFYLGYMELQHGNWIAAQNHFVVVFDSKVGVPYQQKGEYEERGWRSLSDLAHWIVSQGKVVEAISIVQQSIRDDSGSPGWRVLIGLLYEAACEPDKAREAFTIALELAPDSILITEHLKDIGNCLP